MQGLATQQVRSKDYTTLNKGSQRLVCSITSLSTIRALALKSCALEKDLDKSQANLFFFFKHFFVGTKKNATYLKTLT